MCFFAKIFAERNWPDLRRDCDCAWCDRIICESYKKKLTWFTKGLRRPACRVPIQKPCHKRNWPDLRRDCDLTCQRVHTFVCFLLQRNWPDLRRDCDPSLRVWLPRVIRIKETDLIYEGIATSLFSKIAFRRQWGKKLTWFTKGLRLTVSASLWYSLCPKKLTWFTKGLRLPSSYALIFLDASKETDLIYEGIATKIRKSSLWQIKPKRNWPDLRRDCDWRNPPLLFGSDQPKRNWPDLRRDCDV